MHAHGTLKSKTEEKYVYAVFTVRRYASAVYAAIVCRSVCPSVYHKSEFYKDG